MKEKKKVYEYEIDKNRDRQAKEKYLLINIAANKAASKLVVITVILFFTYILAIAIFGEKWLVITVAVIIFGIIIYKSSAPLTKHELRKLISKNRKKQG